MTATVFIEVIGPIASAATAVGVFLALWQLYESRRQSYTAFEDTLSREYRDLARDIPVGALLGEALSEADLVAHLGKFFHYIDLSNEQAFLRQQGRVRPTTWKNWCDGIESNLSRPAFREAWARIKAKAPDSFDELRRLEASGFKEDPRPPAGTRWRTYLASALRKIFAR